MTEQWVHASAFCPNCGRSEMEKYPNNQPVADFRCSHCTEDYELKSTRYGIGAKLVDGAYRTMIERLLCGSNPNLFLLKYDLASLQVRDFFVVPKHFFVPEIIEKRKPLALHARRAGWIGCNILLGRIPETGKIHFVKQGRIEPKASVLAEWQKTLFLRRQRPVSAKSWLLDVLRIIERIGKRDFTLGEVYAFEGELRTLHPENKHIRQKIRQQLQVLRDQHYLDFVSRAVYRLKTA